MVFKNLCIHVLWMKVALAGEGLTYNNNAIKLPTYAEGRGKLAIDRLTQFMLAAPQNALIIIVLPLFLKHFFENI